MVFTREEGKGVRREEKRDTLGRGKGDDMGL
jgi:hypothetical protein